MQLLLSCGNSYLLLISNESGKPILYLDCVFCKIIKGSSRTVGVILIILVRRIIVMSTFIMYLKDIVHLEASSKRKSVLKDQHFCLRLRPNCLYPMNIENP